MAKRKLKGKRKNFKMRKANAIRRLAAQTKKHLPCGSCDYVLTNSQEIDVLSRYILDYPHIETGGQLFGYWTYDGKPVVLFVLGPGQNAGHYNTFFMQDLQYLKECAKLLKQKYGLDHVGEWHSHHQLGLARPSGHDANNIATNMRKLGYKKFLLCIGTCTDTSSMINAFMFDSSKPNYESIPWKIKDIESPFRTIIGQNDDITFLPPKRKKGNMIDLFVVDGITKKKIVSYDDTYWLKKEGSPLIFKSLIDGLKNAYPHYDFTPTIDANHQVHIEVYFNGGLQEDIHFPMGFPFKAPMIKSRTLMTSSENCEWCYIDNIYESFFNFYRNFKKLYMS
jgi:hypothetical protein